MQFLRLSNCSFLRYHNQNSLFHSSNTCSPY